MAWIFGVFLLLTAYLLGSIPTGYLTTKAVKGIDIREHGSGNTGATNVLRVVGKKAAASVLVVDLLKGVSAVLLTQWILTIAYANFPTFLETVPWWMTIAGLLAIVGHSRSVWLNWTGGKSAATGLGVLLSLSWPVGLGVAGIFALTLTVFRIVSLGSIMAALASVVLMLALHQPLPYILLAIAGSFYVILRHRTNIQRLMAGTEPRLGSQSSS
ncbi:glycerol-3-phosphate 1-O-acyltransferase PlsY [Oscillatoria sp. CS-180]|uniref:glycerol-3-phosphate 1-O-acyltransferase PlsY n=1 Tax=Oscillatoria sp. CS-180 TaxID=3021720 RepID=UPI00232E9829|nr:glycerol-3-phosphate 1-O-acyltransferase PlsY [Oscillatoria sp. CS-180]MDB9528933.1 glycerol-3-phosphate 1-O-acyltransferase PlsY [Oscillatoria sp. CS-180]